MAQSQAKDYTMISQHLLAALIVINYIIIGGDLSQSSLQQAKVAKEDGGQHIKEEKKLSDKLRREGIQLLIEAISDASYIDNQRDSAYTKALICDLLWPHNKSVARNCLSDAFDQALSFYEKIDGQPQSGKGTALSGPDVRIEIIRIAARHDPLLSQEFQKKYLEKKSQSREKNPQGGEYGNERTYEQVFGTADVLSNDLIRIAASFLDSDVQMAVNTARQAISASIPRDIVGFLIQLAEHDSVAADKLYIEALERLNKNQIAYPGQLLLLSAYPFKDDKITIFDGNGNRYLLSLQWKEKQNVKDMLARQFILTALRVLSRVAEEQDPQLTYSENQLGIAFYAANALEPKVAKFLPTALSDWDNIKESILYLQTEKARSKIEQEGNSEAGIERTPADSSQATSARVEQLLEQAQSAPILTKRDDLYIKAAIEAATSDDATRAIEIASKINDNKYRENATSWFNFEAALQSLNKKDILNAKRFAENVTPIDQRIYILLKLARGMNSAEERMELLEYAYRQASQSNEGEEKLRAAVGIANLFLDFFPENGLNAVSNMMNIANQVQSSSFDLPRMVRTLPTHRGRGYRTVVNYEGFDIRALFSKMAQIDIENSLQIAQSTSNRVIRLQAISAVANVMLRSSLQDKKSR